MQVAEEEASAPMAGTALCNSAGQPSVKKETKEQPLAGCAVYQTDEGEADSDDDDEAAGRQPAQRAALPPRAAAGYGETGEAVFADEFALNEEVDRLMMALQGTPAATTPLPEPPCDPAATFLASLFCFA